MSTEVVLIFVSFAGIEVISRILGWLVDPRKIHGAFALRRYSILPAIGAVGVIGLSFADTSALVGHPTPARMAAGSLSCILGLLIRYPLAMPRLLTRGLRLEWERVRWVFEMLRMRHPRYLGLIAEIAGLSAILGSPLGVAATGLALVPTLVLAAKLEEKWVLANYPGSGLDFDRRERSLLWPPALTAALLLLLPGLLYLTVAFSTRELALFNSGEETARTLLVSMAGAQGTWAILALSLTLVIMQVVTSNYSTNLAQLAGLRWPLIAALAFLAASVLYDVIVVARIDDWVVGHRDRGGALVDLGLMWSGLSLTMVLIASVESTGHVKAERLMERLLRRLDAKWLQNVSQQWPAPFGPRQLNADDPIRGVESVLRSLAAKRDLGSMRIILAQLRGRLEEITSPQHRDPPEHWVALDACISYHMSSLVRATAREMDEETLTEWLNLARFTVEHLRVDRDYLARNKVSWLRDVPPGEALLREVMAAALTNRHGAPASQGIWLTKRCAEHVMSILPHDDECFLYNPDHGSLREISEQDRERRYENDDLVQLLEHGYVDYLGDVGMKAIEASLPRVAWSASYALCLMTSDACHKIQGSPAIRRSVVRQALFMLMDVSRTSCQHRTRGAVHIGGLDGAIDALDAENQDDADLIVELAGQTAAIVGQLAKHGLLDYGTVVEAAIVGLHGGKRLADAGRIVVEALGQALDTLPQHPSFDPDGEHSLVMSELPRRIDQVAMATRGEGAEAVMKLAREILERHESQG